MYVSNPQDNFIFRTQLINFKSSQHQYSEITVLDTVKSDGKYLPTDNHQHRYQIFFNVRDHSDDSVKKVSVLGSPSEPLGALMLRAGAALNKRPRFMSSSDDRPVSGRCTLDELNVMNGFTIFVVFEDTEEVNRENVQTAISRKPKDGLTQPMANSKGVRTSCEIQPLPVNEAEKQLRELQRKYNKLLVLLGRLK